MSGAAQPPPPGQPPRKGYLLAPIACRHRERSRGMILRAAAAAAPGRVAVLGAGACEEIPVAELVERFADMTLNDVEEQPLREAVDALDLAPKIREKLRIEVADLSGLTKPALARIENVIATAADPSEAIGAMASVLDAVEAEAFPIAGRFDLIVASCVLSQLHFGLTHRAAASFETRFPGDVDRLRQSEVWKTALYKTARRMEERFIAEVAMLVVDGGLVYLSESTQMCYVQLAPHGQWQTEGTYRMLRTKDLADYVRQRFTVSQRERWEWIVSPPANAGETGRMYDVQALVLRPRAY